MQSSKNQDNKKDRLKKECALPEQCLIYALIGLLSSSSDSESDEEVSKVVRKSDDALIIEEWMSDSEKENVSQPKTKKKTGNPQMDLQDKGVVDNGCSRHMTGNMSYLTDYDEIDEG
ncbi:hypothetical protein Tco_1352137 [Tanacetum coccineum]